MVSKRTLMRKLMFKLKLPVICKLIASSITLSLSETLSFTSVLSLQSLFSISVNFSGKGVFLHRTTFLKEALDFIGVRYKIDGSRFNFNSDISHPSSLREKLRSLVSLFKCFVSISRGNLPVELRTLVRAKALLEKLYVFFLNDFT